MTNEDKTLAEAIIELTKLYKSAVKQTEIKNPIAYALFYTWKKFDKGD